MKKLLSLFTTLPLVAILMFGSLTFAGTGDIVVEGKPVTGKIEVGGGTLELPNSDTLPGTCAVGDTYVLTSTFSGQQCYVCESTDVWISQGSFYSAAYFPDYNEADQGVTGNDKSAKAYIDTISTNSASLVFRHNSGAATTTYTFGTSETTLSNINIVIEKGAILSIAAAQILTISGPFNAGLYPVFNGDGDVVFSQKTSYTYEWFESSAKMVIAVPEGSTVIVNDFHDIATVGRIVTHKVFKIVGNNNYRIGHPTPAGAGFYNTGADTVDSPIIEFNASAVTRRERPTIKGLFIEHDGATSYAVVINNMIHSQIDDNQIQLGGTGYGGIKYENLSYFCYCRNNKILDFAGKGILVDGGGSQHIFEDNQCETTLNNTVCLETKCQYTKIIRGQYDANSPDGTSGIAIYFNPDSNLFGGTVDDVIIESSPTGVKLGGAAHIRDANIYNLNVPLTMAGVAVNFNNARDCKVINPQVDQNAGPLTLFKWGASAIKCGAEISISLADLAVYDVDAAATYSYVKILGTIDDGIIASITTDPNLEIFMDGCTDFGANLHHNGVAWNMGNFPLVTNNATSFTPQTAIGKMLLINRSNIDFAGEVLLNTSPQSVIIGGGAHFEVTTGALAGATGNAGKVTVSAHTDGKVYIENRSGTTKYFNWAWTPQEY